MCKCYLQVQSEPLSRMSPKQTRQCLQGPLEGAWRHLGCPEVRKAMAQGRCHRGPRSSSHRFREDSTVGSERDKKQPQCSPSLRNLWKQAGTRKSRLVPGRTKGAPRWRMRRFHRCWVLRSSFFFSLHPHCSCSPTPHTEEALVAWLEE